MSKHAYLLRRPLALLLVLALALMVALAALPTRVAATAGYPDSMAALGDSITKGFMTGNLQNQPIPREDPTNSWATGINPDVSSIYLRLLERNPDIQGDNANYAISGTKMETLPYQASQVAPGTELVTILMGHNDACAPTIGAMTPVATYRAQFAATMSLLAAQNPEAKIYVLSLIDIYQLWELFHTTPAAIARWAPNDLFPNGACQALLANPTSYAPEDIARRAEFRQRIMDYNDVLASVCSQHQQCVFDGYATFNTRLMKSDVSRRDFFHPSISGQAHIAEVAWNASPYAP